MEKESTKKPIVTDEPMQTVKAVAYPVDELAWQGAMRFNTSPDIIMAALKKAGKDEYTIAEAEQIINKFKAKEVK